jgi:hypothetical protein
MFRCSLQPNKRQRFTAWLLLLVCAWMGTGGVLHHTEDDGMARLLHVSASAVHHSAVVPDDTCAACEWTQGLQGQPLSVCRVEFPLFLLHSRRQSAAARIIARTAIHRPSRAPPVSFFC